MSGDERRRLSWSIKKKLYQLTADEAYDIATHLDPVAELDSERLNKDDEEGCIEYITAYMNSSTLLQLEDEGLVMLLCLQDTIDLVITNRDKGRPPPKDLASGEGTPVMPPASDNINGKHISPMGGYTPEVATPNFDIHQLLTDSGEGQNKSHRHSINAPDPEGPQCRTGSCGHISGPRATNSPPTDIRHPLIPQQHHMAAGALPAPAHESVIALRDLPLLQRKEFKIHGGQITDTASDISFNSICKQIDDGRREQHTDDDIIRGVLRVIKGGNFKDMLVNKEDLTVTELKSFLQSHLREKTSTELFQELMCAKQHENESPQQFLYRMIGLKQRITFTSKQASSVIKYDASTLQGVFLNAVYQGMGERHEDLRRDLKPLLADPTVSDEALLRQVIQTTMEDNERKRRLGRSTNRKFTQAHSTVAEPEGMTGVVGETRVKGKDNVIQRLSAQVEALTEAMETLRKLTAPALVPGAAHQIVQQSASDKTKSDRKTRRPYGCPECVAQGRPSCNHCFSCGEVGHRAIGCLKRNMQSGNECRSGLRGNP